MSKVIEIKMLKVAININFGKNLTEFPKLKTKLQIGHSENIQSQAVSVQQGILRQAVENKSIS